MRQQRFAPAPEAEQERGGRQRIAVNDRLRHAQQRVRRQPRQSRIRVSPRLGGLQERITRAGSVGKSAQSALDAFADVRQRGIIRLIHQPKPRQQQRVQRLRTVQVIFQRLIFQQVRRTPRHGGIGG